MIQSGTFLNVIDNSGAKKAYCIKILNTGYKQRYAKIGNLVLVSIKTVKYSKNIKVKKGEICKALIVRAKQKCYTNSSHYKKFSKNDIVLINKKNKLLGTRIFGTLPKILKSTRYNKILFLCSGLSF
jgi:large subunit ribosomal protein L14